MTWQVGAQLAASRSLLASSLHRVACPLAWKAECRAQTLCLCLSSPSAALPCLTLCRAFVPSRPCSIARPAAPPEALGTRIASALPTDAPATAGIALALAVLVSAAANALMVALAMREQPGAVVGAGQEAARAEDPQVWRGEGSWAVAAVAAWAIVSMGLRPSACSLMGYGLDAEGHSWFCDGEVRCAEVRAWGL
jgi:hypothetical protein